MKTALTIAGSDSSGGAGIQADLKTFTAHKVYGMSVITAITAQNTCGVTDVHDVPVEIVKKQMDAVYTDIVPDGVKIGMLSSPKLILAVAEKLQEYQAEKIVLDTVMISKSGFDLLKPEAVNTLRSELLKLAYVITPNIPEAERLSGIKIETKEDMLKAAKALEAYTDGYILIKGGHLKDTADDLLYDHGKADWFLSERVDTKNTHGTGCTLSSAIASNLVLGYSPFEAVKRAKEYVTRAMSTGLSLGHGAGPLNHMV